MPTTDKLLSVSQVADRLGVSKTYIQRLIGRGYFPGAVQLGEFERSPYAIPEKDLKAFVKDWREWRRKKEGE